MRGRPRQFDRGPALDAAADVFRRLGFDGASMSDLQEAMGMGAQSIYNAFGNKDALYVAALDRYVEQASSFFQQLAQEGTVEDLVGLVRSKSRASSDALPCLVKRTLDDEHCLALKGVGPRTRTHLAGIERAFFAVIKRAVDRDELECDDPPTVARYLHMCFHGLGVVSRGSASGKSMDSLLDYALAPLI